MGKLIFLCGKMAAGKSTLSKVLREREDAVLLVLDDFLERLYPGQVVDIASFVTYSSRISSRPQPTKASTAFIMNAPNNRLQPTAAGVILSRCG